MTGVDKPLAGVPRVRRASTADGGFVAIGTRERGPLLGVASARPWSLLHGDLPNRERTARVRELNAEIAAVIVTLSAATALERLAAHDVPATPVRWTAT